MYLIKIPLLYVRLEIYQGKSEFDKFKKIVSSFPGCEEFEKEKHAEEKGGWAYGSMIWIEDVLDQNTVFHELQHVIDHLAEDHEFTREKEFKAYLAGFLAVKVISIMHKEDAKRKGEKV